MGSIPLLAIHFYYRISEEHKRFGVDSSFLEDLIRFMLFLSTPQITNHIDVLLNCLIFLFVGCCSTYMSIFVAPTNSTARGTTFLSSCWTLGPPYRTFIPENNGFLLRLRTLAAGIKELLRAVQPARCQVTRAAFCEFKRGIMTSTWPGEALIYTPLKDHSLSSLLWALQLSTLFWWVTFHWLG